MQNWWPAWFPYPSSWFRTIVLILAIGILAWSAKIFGSTGFFLSQATNNLSWLIRFLFVGLIFPFILIAYLHHFIINRGKRPAGWPRHLPSPRSVAESFYGLNVFILSTLLMAGIAISFCNPAQGCQNVSEPTIILVSVFWTISIAYFYQAEYLIRRFSASAKSSNHPIPSTTKVSSSVSPAQSLDAEIEQMRKDLGLH